jgi:uncharacterized protein (DUF111 family)
MASRWKAVQNALVDYRKAMRARITMESSSVNVKIAAFQEKLKKLKYEFDSSDIFSYSTGADIVSSKLHRFQKGMTFRSSCICSHCHCSS